MTVKMHLLVHVADSVGNLGPLWTHFFHFEDNNGHLLRPIHGIQNIPVQMVNAVKIIHLPCITQNIKLKTVAADFLSKMTGDKVFCAINAVSCISKVGSSLNLCLNTENICLLEQFIGQKLIQYCQSF